MGLKNPHDLEPADDAVLPADDGVAWIVVARPPGAPGWLAFHVGPFPTIESVVRWVDAHPDVEYHVLGLIHPDDFLAHPDAPGDAP